MKRNYNIDIIRGIAILLVVVHHAIVHVVFTYNELFSKFLESFASLAIPLFFIISGYFYFCKNEEKQLQTIKYILYLYIIGTIITIFLQPEIINNGLINIITGRYLGDIWYIHHLLLFHILTYGIKNNKFGISITSIFILFLMVIYNPSAVYLFQIIPYLIGCFLSIFNKESIILNTKNKLVYDLLFIVMIAGIILIPIFVNYTYYSHSFIIFAISLNIMWIAINSTSKKETIISKIGANSLILYFSQYISWNLINILQEDLIKDMSKTYTIILFVIIIVIIMPFMNIINNKLTAHIKRR